MNRRVLLVGVVGGVVGVAAGCGGKTREDATRAGTGGSAGHGGVEHESGTEGIASRAGGSSSEPSGKAVGYFNVALIAAIGGMPAHTSVTGFVYDGVPNTEATISMWELLDEQGGCQLLRYAPPFCEVDCGTGSACIDDDVCRRDPTRRDVGTVTVCGLQTADGSSEFTMHPIGNAYQPALTVDVLYPPCAEGAEIRVETSGGDYAPFQIESQGISPLEVLGGDEVALETGQPVTLQWTPAGQAGVSRIRVVLNISHFGGRRGQIICDTDDTGSLEIPASLATQLLELGYSGWPYATIERRAVGTVEIEPGRVDLKVSSSLERSIAIPGLISCFEDSDCPEGQTCQTDFRCM